MTDLLNEIAELRAMKVPQLVERYAEVFGRPARIKHHAWLWKKVAHGLQTRRLGGLSKLAKAKLETLIGEIRLPLDETTRPIARVVPEARTASGIAVGTVLVREWHGRQLRVQVLDRGFEYEGVVYKSLSAVANSATGAHWNGRAFFGLTPARDAS